MEENNLEAARDMRKIVLYIAMSLDGYIADANGGVSWLRGQDSDSESEGSYPEFVRDIRPGEIITITEQGISSDYTLCQEKKAHCIFEYIYFI